MKQYCRYCVWLCVNNAPYCDKKKEFRSKSSCMHRLGKWQNVKNKGSRPPCDNIRLMKTMYTMAQKYSINWIFCSPYESAAKIVELLTGEENGKST